MSQTVDALNALSIFGPGQFGAYREHAAEVREALGPDIETKIQRYVRRWASGSAPGALILTGNAGTGKTALVEAYCDELGVASPTEDGLREVAEGRLVVKDFSGVGRPERREILALERAIRAGARDAQLFLCANEGVLRDALNDSPDPDFEQRLNTALEAGAMLADPDDREPAILNMNRQRWTDGELWVRLLDYLVREELWGDCEGCPSGDSCPIRANAAALRRPGPREAARHLVQLGSGGAVATLRELLAILAHSVTGGLSCAEVASVANGREFTAEIAYFNLFFGAGLDPERIERSALLQGLREAEVGATADVEVDGWLRDPAPAPSEIRELATPVEATPHARVATAVGVMTFGQLGETITVSDDAARVDECLRDFATGGDFLSLWRRRVFFEAQPFLSGRSGAFRRMTRFSSYGDQLDLAESLRRGADTAEARQLVVVGLNYLAAGFHAFTGHLVVPDSGSLAARNPGSFRPPAPSVVHSRVQVESVALSLEDGPELRNAIDTDDVRAVVEAQTQAGTKARLLLTPRLFQAVRDSGDFRAPVGSDIPEMNELAAFYASLASDPVEPGMRIVDPALEVIRDVTLPALSQ